MTPEERQRAMDFIVEHMARFATNMDRLEANMDRSDAKMKQWEAAFEQEREERSKDRARLARVEAAFVTLTEIAEIQSRRLDSHEQEFYALLNRGDDDRRQAQQRHEEAIAYLKEILNRLTQKN